ncbi:MAG: DUF5753 domain-containing protein, partial [Umezawaea sp.]
AVLLGACKTPVAEREHLLALHRESTAKGWWQGFEPKFPSQLRTLIEHEQLATEVISWQMNLVCGLLQTPDYMRAVISASATVPSSEIDVRVAARLDRQRVVEGRREFIFYVHEQALRLPVGGPAVMSDQLHHLLRMSVRPYIAVRVVPTGLGAHAGLAGAFTLFRLSGVEPVVFVEGETSSLFVEAKAQLDSFKKVLGSIAQAALDEEQSRNLITEIAT